MRILRKVREFIASIPIGVKNLIAYAPLIWRDRDWDHSYFLELLRFKLTRMERCFEKYIDRKPNNAEAFLQIRDARDALSRYLADDYLPEEYAAHKRRWGERVCPVCGDWICDCFPVKGGYAWVAVYENVDSAEDADQASEEMADIILRARQMRVNDLKYAFEMIGKHVEDWWD